MSLFVLASYARADFDIPPEGRVAFTSDEGGNVDIYVMDADGSGRTRLTSTNGRDESPSWKSDGTAIAYSADGSGDREIFVMNADGSGQVNLSNTPGADEVPAFSPDGTTIVFTSFRDGNGEIYVMNADGTNPVRLTNNGSLDHWPVWSPDGSKIAFTSQRDGDREVYVMNSDGSGQTNLTNNAAGSDQLPAWSEDGTKIIYQSFGGTTSDIFVMNADGTGQTNLTNSAGVNEAFSDYSPDGFFITYDSFADSNSEVFVMGANGTTQTNVSNNAADDWDPDWGPAVEEPQPDLFVAKTDSTENSGNVGVEFNWLLNIINNGGAPAVFGDGQTVIEDDLPTGPSYGTPTVTYSDGSTGSMTCTIAPEGGAQRLTCAADVGGLSLAAHAESGTIVTTVFIPTTPNETGSITNPADGGVCAVDPHDVIDESDETNSQNCGPDTVEVSPAPTSGDLLVSKANDTETNTVDVGETFNWLVTVVNIGNADAVLPAGATFLVDELPENATFGAPSITLGSGVTGAVDCAIAPDSTAFVVTCTVTSELTIPTTAGDTVITIPTTPLSEGDFHNPRLPDGVCAVDPAHIVSPADGNDACDLDTVTASVPVNTTLTLVKVVTEDNGGSTPATAWTLSAAGPSPFFGMANSPAVTNIPITPGTYSFNETGPMSYYSPNTWSCTVNGGPAQVGHTRFIAAGENVVCTLENNDRDLQFVVGGDLTGSVQEGGTETDSGTLSGDTNRNSFRINSGVNANATAAPEFAIDHFTVLVEGSPIIDNPFNVPPPAGPDAFIPTTGNTWTASGGRATVAPGGHTLSVQVGDGASRVFGGARYNTTPSPGATLRKSVNFSAAGIFDLIVPDETLEAYGISFSDGITPNLPQRNAVLALFRDTDGQLKVSLNEDNATLRQRINRGTVVVTPAAGDDQIRFRLNHVSGQNVITASFELLDNGVVTATVPLPGSVRAFDVGNYVQPSIFATVPGTLDSVLEGTYGNLTVDQASGAWDYVLGVTPAQDTAVAGLASGAEAHDVFSVRGQEYTNGPFASTNLDITVTAATDPTTGTLIVKKIVSGGPATASQFSFSVNGGPATPFEADGQNDLTVAAGTYTVTETPPANYTASYNNCSNVAVAAGGTATCTITNTFNGPVVNLPPNKDACKKDGWKNYTDNLGVPFKNQGQCVSFTNHN